MTSLIALVNSLAILALTPVSIPTLHSQIMTGMLSLREDGLLRPSVSRNVAVGDCNAAPPLLESAMTWISGRDGLRVRQKPLLRGRIHMPRCTIGRGKATRLTSMRRRSSLHKGHSPSD